MLNYVTWSPISKSTTWYHIICHFTVSSRIFHTVGCFQCLFSVIHVQTMAIGGGDLLVLQLFAPFAVGMTLFAHSDRMEQVFCWHGQVPVGTVTTKEASARSAMMLSSSHAEGLLTSAESEGQCSCCNNNIRADLTYLIQVSKA